jgi:DNA replication protein DnaC
MAKVQSLPILLKELRLSAMANAWQEMAHKAVNEQWQPEEYLVELCEIEAHQRHESRLPTGKQLSQYDFSEITGISAQQMKQKAHSVDWVRQGHNMIIFGASGLGKTHLAAALGYTLITQSIRVKFTSSTALVQQLQKARKEFGLEDALKKLDKYELLILDDIGYVKKSDSESQVLFELIAHRYERGSLLITTNQAFSEWDSIFGDNIMTVAAIDRLVHHADIYQIEGDSYRKKQALERNSNRPS